MIHWALAAVAVLAGPPRQIVAGPPPSIEEAARGGPLPPVELRPPVPQFWEVHWDTLGES